MSLQSFFLHVSKALILSSALCAHDAGTLQELFSCLLRGLDTRRVWRSVPRALSENSKRRIAEQYAGEGVFHHVSAAELFESEPEATHNSPNSSETAWLNSPSSVFIFCPLGLGHYMKQPILSQVPSSLS